MFEWRRKNNRTKPRRNDLIDFRNPLAHGLLELVPGSKPKQYVRTEKLVYSR